MSKVKVELHKYHIHTADEFEFEEGSKTVQFAVFTERIENLMLGVAWITPIGRSEEIEISDIQHIDFLGTEVVELDNEMDSHFTDVKVSLS